METIDDIQDVVDEKAARALDHSSVILEAGLAGEILSDDEIHLRVEAKAAQRRVDESNYLAVLAISRTRLLL